MNPPSASGKMKASGDESGHSCFQSHRSSASSFGRCTRPKLFLVLPQPNGAFEGGLEYVHFRFRLVEALPAKSKQLAWTQGIRHVELQQNAIPQRQMRKRVP